MRRNILIILAALSCSEDFDPTKGFDFCVLAGTSYTNTYGSYVFENVFDSSHRITSILSNGNVVAKFEYKDSIVNAMFEDRSQIITLNKKGFPVKSVDETGNLMWRVYYSGDKPLSILLPSTTYISPNQRYDSIVMKLDMTGNVITDEFYVYDEITQARQFRYATNHKYDDKINPFNGLFTSRYLSWGNYFSVNNELTTYTYTYYDSGYPSSRMGGGTDNFIFRYNCF